MGQSGRKPKPSRLALFNFVVAETDSGGSYIMVNDADNMTSKAGRFWPQLRKLLIFQLKLYIDAIRDIIFSVLSLGAFILDVLQQDHGPDSSFEKILQLGRRTNHGINLFNQFDHEAHEGKNTVDDLIKDVEDKIRRT